MNPAPVARRILASALAAAALAGTASEAAARQKAREQRMWPATESYITPGMDALIRSGIDGIYRMDFEGAEADFRRLEALKPGHPFAGFGLCSVAWARYVYGDDENDPALVAAFEEQVRRAVASGQAWTEAHPRDAESLMALGAIHGILGRLLATRRQYIRAYLSGRSAMKSVRAALALDPELYDARLGLGMYDYYTDLYPRLVRALAKVILRGDRQRGIDSLRLAARKGRYMSVTAKMVLVEIYTNDPFGAKDPEAAVGLIREIRRRYPGSPMLHSAQLFALFCAGRKEELLEGARQYVSHAESGRYPRRELAKGKVMLGNALWLAGRGEEALAAFKAGWEAAQAGASGRWPAWGLLRAGQTADLLRRRDEALELYKQVDSLRDPWGIGRLARKYASKPFSQASEPLPFLPP